MRHNQNKIRIEIRDFGSDSNFFVLFFPLNTATIYSSGRKIARLKNLSGYVSVQQSLTSLNKSTHIKNEPRQELINGPRDRSPK